MIDFRDCDHVFDERSSNASVYELLTKDIIHAAVEGFNGTVFAYGQTSSGKTFTMTGSETDPGIIRRSVRDVFERIQMNLVDLAGSERITKTGAGGVRLTEGKYINKSLMILGNVINKLSESAKLRGHIPYRDSKLTRILQPALGGNAKTCIICTIAPEEYHIEESKGTLQFANRAKRITNCAQVNEYELECERLKTQLEEERRKQKDQEQCGQQLKTENLNSLVTNDSSDVPGTPCFKPAERAFVVARTNYSELPDFSPMVDSLGDLADEDTWEKLNKGFVPDLNSLQFTPAVRSQPIPFTTATMECSREDHKEVEKLKSQIDLLNKEKDSLQVKFNEQVVMNNKLMEDISELKQEMLHMKEIPKRLYESVANCKDVYKNVIVTIKSFMAEKETPRAKLFFGVTEITTSLLSTLESQFSVIMDGQKAGSGDHPLSDQWETLRVNLKNTTTSLLSDAQAKDEILNCHNKEEETAALEEKLKCELSIIMERYNDVIMDGTKESELVAGDGELDLDLEEALHVPAGPMTRAKTKRLREAFIGLIQKMDRKIINLDRKIIYEDQIQDGNIWICISAKEITHGDWAFNLAQVELSTAKNQDETLVHRWVMGENANGPVVHRPAS
ncbi:hypothetical protein Bca4012_013167 [Brassica carinata]